MGNWTVLPAFWNNWSILYFEISRIVYSCRTLSNHLIIWLSLAFCAGKAWGRGCQRRAQFPVSGNHSKVEAKREAKNHSCGLGFMFEYWGGPSRCDEDFTLCKITMLDRPFVTSCCQSPWCHRSNLFLMSSEWPIYHSLYFRCAGGIWQSQISTSMGLHCWDGISLLREWPVSF